MTPLILSSHLHGFLFPSKEETSFRGKNAFVRNARRAHLESPFCSLVAKMQRVAWWEAPYPRRVQHPAASRSPAEVPGPSAASRIVAADVRPVRTSSRSPKSRPRSCLPAEVSFLLRGLSTPTYARDQPSGPILSVATRVTREANWTRWKSIGGNDRWIIG